MRAFYFSLFLVFAVSATAQEHLISFELVDTFSVEKLKARWKSQGIPKFITPIKNDVEVYDIMYYTTYGDGSKVKASGLYFMPKGTKNDEFPFVIYNHGTTIRPERRLGYNGEEQIALMFSTDGYGVAMPDYVGLGHGERVHLYVHAESEANAGIDMMKAIDEMNLEFKIKRNDLLFTTGYSQGGHATMAVHKMLQEKYADKYPITASSPMSGPYDLSDTQAQVMFSYYTQPHYLPYLLIGYNEIYNLFPKDNFYADVFSDPYSEMVPKLFDRNHSVGDVNAALPEIPEKMLSDSLVSQFKTNPDFEFKKVLESNNVYDWKPEAPVQICYCKGDEEVRWENAIVAYSKMKENGAKHITKRHVGKKYTHRGCADFSVVYTKFYFDSFRKGSKKGRKGPWWKRWAIGVAKLFM